MNSDTIEPVRRRSRMNGREIAYRDAGAEAAPVLVFLHGLGGNATTWRGQYRALSDDYRVIGWDMPGYGGSDPLEGDPGPGDYADALLGFLESLSLSRVHLVAQSVAALIGSALARRAPGQLLSLTFVHPLLGFGALDDKDSDEAVAARVGAFEELGPRGFAESRGPGLLAAGAARDLVDEVVSAMGEARSPGYQQAVRMMAAADLIDEAPSIETRCQVIAGAEDPLSPVAACEALADALGGANLCVIDGAGHYAALEQPTAFDRTIRAFAGS